MTANDPRAEAVAALGRLPELIAADAPLVRRCRFMTLDMGVVIGDERFHVVFEAGRVCAVDRGTQILRSSAFTFRAAPEVWLRHWRPVPAPGDHDVFALVKNGEASVSGDMHALMIHLQNVKDVLAAPRRLFGKG